MISKFADNVIKKFPSEQRLDLKILKTNSQEDGLESAKEILYKIVDKKTVLFLSGGSTPKNLYEALAKEKKLKIGASAMIDERFGKKYHQNSNEKMIKDAGFLKYLKEENIQFYPIILDQKDRSKTAENYEEKVRSLFFSFPKSVAILGIGKDGHIAGIPANLKLKTKDSTLRNGYSFTINSDDIKQDRSSFVFDYNDERGFYRERISLTFKGLEMMDFLIVLVFGEDKKDALEKMFADGTIEEIPARFYLRPEIAEKTLLITDQEI